MNEQILKCCLIRHGMTGSNVEKRYAGIRTDEALCREGIHEIEDHKAQSMYPAVSGPVFSSPMKRCLETASLITGSEEIVPVPGLEEIDFGRFEGHTWQELSADPDYCSWIDSGGTLPFPGGESMDRFVYRTMTAFREILDISIAASAREIYVFCHGGSIRAVMSVLTKKDYWAFDAKCGTGYELKLKISGDDVNVISYNRISPRSGT